MSKLLSIFKRIHKAGFVSIIGKPNVGKSTLMNQMVGERLSIITSKAQTTRHRIMGILSGDDFQVIYSDTPGIIKPEYELHSSMMSFVNSSLEDADVVLLVTDIYDKYDEHIALSLKRIKAPVIFILNKIDQAKGTQVADKITYWKTVVQASAYLSTSALEGKHIDIVFVSFLDLLPEHPAFFPKDQLTDKPEKFFVEEIIREKIFLNYKKHLGIPVQFNWDLKLSGPQFRGFVKRDFWTYPIWWILILNYNPIPQYQYDESMRRISSIARCTKFP